MVTTLSVTPESFPRIAPVVLAAALAHLFLGLPPIFRHNNRTVSAVGLCIDVVMVGALAIVSPLPPALLLLLALLPAGLAALRFGVWTGIAIVVALWLTAAGAQRVGFSVESVLAWLTATSGITLVALVASRTRTSVELESVPAHEDDPIATFSYLNRMLSTQPDSQRILEILLEIGSDVINPERPDTVHALALTFDSGRREQLRISAVRRIDSSHLNRCFRAQEGIFREILSSGDAVLTDGDQRPLDRIPELEGLRVVLIPVRTVLDVYGLVLFACEEEPGLDRHGDRRLELLLATIGQCALALQNAVLQSELRKKHAEVLLDEEESRRRLARDFHDGPIQRVAAIAMQIEYIKVLLNRQPERVLPELDAVRSLALQTVTEMRTMLFALRPVTLERDGLLAAIEQFIQRLREQERVNIRLEADKIPRLEPQIEETVFAILQEAASNAKKHANGAPITVRLTVEDRFLIAQVEDKGPGFDVERTLSGYGARASLGMVNMQERAHLIDGRLTIDSAPGSGTVVSLAVPLPRAA